MTNRYSSFRCSIALFCCLLCVATLASAQDYVIQTQDHTIPNPGAGGGDEFGYAISVDNEQLDVGAPITGLSADNGFVRLFDFDTVNNAWIESANQLPDQSNNNIKWGWYGAAVSILGDTVVVGAPLRDPNSAFNNFNGAAFIYRWITGSGWDTTVLDGVSKEHLGTSVSQIANFIAIGAPFHEKNGFDHGGVYMYERAAAGDAWSLVVDPLGNPDPLEAPYPNEEFGYAVTLFTDQASDDWLVVGAPGANKAYVYKRGLSDWGAAFVLLPDPTTADKVVAFGNSVTMTETLNDTWIIVGDPEYGTNDPQANFQGHVEIYRLSGSTWPHFQTIEAPDKRFNGYFGISLDASGNHVAIGSHQAHSCTQTASTNGAGYVLTFDGTSWTSTTNPMNKLISREDYAGLGRGIAIDGETVLAGAYLSTGGGHVLTYTTILDLPLDCDGLNGPDALEWCNGTAMDCNNNEVIDACDITSGTSFDCDSTGDGLGNGIPDECEFASNTVLDCNGNGIPDSCDLINDPALYDCNGNGVLDDCEMTNGLHVIFIIDGSGSVDSTEFTLQKNTVKKELCTLTTYSNIDPLVVTVLVICSSPETPYTQFGPVLFQHGEINEICTAIGNLAPDGVGTNVFSTLIEAEAKFLSQSPTLAREIVLMGDGDGNWTTSHAQGDVLRSMTPPVRICTASIPNPVQQGSCGSQNYKKLANTTNTISPVNPNQPLGEFVCLEVDPVENNYPLYSGLCTTCLTDWGGPNDCNGDGVLDECSCPGDIAGPSEIPGVEGPPDGVVDVTDLLVIISNWGQACSLPSCVWDINGSGIIDVGDLLAIIDNWGCGVETGPCLPMPQSIQDCLNRYPLGSQQLESCIEFVEFIIQQSN